MIDRRSQKVPLHAGQLIEVHPLAIRCNLGNMDIAEQWRESILVVGEFDHAILSHPKG